MIKLFAIFILYSFAVRATLSKRSDGQPTMPNIDYLGRGYDIFRSEPRPIDGGVDSGYVGNIIDMTISERGHLSNDGRYAVPDAADVVECLACRFTLDVQTMQTTHEYVRTVEQQVSKGNDKLEWATGQSSPSYGNAGHEMTENQRTLVDASLSCLVYCAQVLVFEVENSNLSLGFADAVRKLAPSDETSVNEFLEKYGTHFVYSMKMGSLYWQRSTYHNLDWPKATSAVKSVKRALRISALGNWTDLTEDEAEMVDIFKQYAIARFTHRVGPPFTHDRSWLDVTREDPMPVTLSLLPVTDMMNPFVFPNDASIDLKRRVVEDAILNGSYCSYILEKSGMPGECVSKESLQATDVSRFVGNPNSLDTCVGGTRFPVFGGVFVRGKTFPNVVNAKTNTYGCLNGSKYIQYSAVVLTSEIDSVTYCTIGQRDLEGIFGGMGSTIFYAGDCGAIGVTRLYPPIDPKITLPTFYKRPYNLTNPFTGQPDKSCPAGFPPLPLASLQVDTRPNTGPWGTGYCTMAVNVYVCFNAREFYNGAFLGGFFTTWKDGKMRHDNPITKSTTCPPNYEPHLILRGNQDGDHEAFACMLKGSP